ncbi:PEGA domain-containing protein, partial [Candidatus Latescibacterota bacterium]
MRSLKCFFIVLALIFFSSSFSHGSSLLIRSKVSGASISIDSRELGITDEKGIFYIDNISPGSHRITVTKEEYDVYSMEINVDEQLTTIVNVVLLTSDKEPPEIMILSPGSPRGIKPVVSDDLVEVIGLVRDESE